MPLRILVIDDHRDYRAWLGHHLAVVRPDAEVIGHDPGGTSPLPAEFEAGRWDLVFLDYHPAEHDGLALLASLKAAPTCPPIVLLTPQGNQQAIIRALETGADDFLAKGPASNEHIERVVREALRRRGQPVRQVRADLGEEALPGFKLKGHRFLKSLGTGSTASVYLMERLKGERLVVAKVFRQVPDKVGHFTPLQRFLREYEVVAGIRHPNVVRIFDLGIADDMAFIVMEYFPGGHLGEHLSRGFTVVQALGALAQIAAALEAIHGVGVLHRDLKPANIMLRDDASLALIDFGVAKLRDNVTEITGVGELFGTPYYMSPEQGHGAPIDERADIYSLGVLFFEMLTGRKPYVAGSPLAVLWKHRHAPRPQLPESLAVCQLLLSAMMAKDPAERPASAGEVRAAAARLLAEMDADPAMAPLIGAEGAG